MLHHVGVIVMVICALGADALRLSNILSRPIIHRNKTKHFATTSGIGWDSHQAIQSIPESLVKTIDGNESMRKKFEQLCRRSQVRRRHTTAM